MIIAGDIACPNEKCSLDLKKIIADNATVFAGKSLVCNFEGLINDDINPRANTPVLYNHSSVVNVLERANTKAVALANNHILDLPFCFDDTLKKLTEHNIAFTGAGKSLAEAAAPVSFFEGNHEVVLFNECWDFLLYHQKNPTQSIHIATIQFQDLAQRVKECKSKNPLSCILVYLHWSLDFETLPYPMYRTFANALIDAGATIVAGCHSHCVQGGEQYKDGYIVYGLGNFFLPNHIFANGKLSFPSFAAVQLLFEFDIETREAFCHWFKYENQEGRHTLTHLETSPFSTSELMKKYAPYQGMAHLEYIQYFKKHRRKKTLIPLFKEYQNKQQLAMHTSLLKARARFARMMAKLNLIKWGS